MNSDSYIFILRYILSGITKKISLKIKGNKYQNYIIDKADILISKKLKIIYIRNPKVANRNFCRAIINLDSSACYKKVNKNDFKTIYKDFFVFSFVRNPWHRVYSAYNNNKMNYPNKLVSLGFFITFSELYYKMPFTRFVDFLYMKEGQDQYTDIHWTSQYKILTYRGKAICNYIGKLETLRLDLSKIEQILNIKINLAQRIEQRNYEGENGYLEYYTEELIRKVYFRYKMDCSIYDYSIKDEIEMLRKENLKSLSI